MKTETGNPAAIRDALNEAVSVLHVCLDPDFPPTYECLRATIDKCEAALAEPLRNCDKYATVDEAMAYFADEALIEEWNALKAGKERDLLAEELFGFIKWLYALATKKEGDEK